ncbi:hypothetical protein [Nocardia sp. CA-135398]|uniref:hypothetical protein n=1 Tax=Nocardia sp. CA-135398 TaxID=3239977 RepID=UPI003D95FEC3
MSLRNFKDAGAASCQLSDPVLSEIQDADGDPVHPGMAAPTPIGDVARLTRSQREIRVRRLIEQAEQIVQVAVSAHLGGRRIAALCVCCSPAVTTPRRWHICSVTRQHTPFTATPRSWTCTSCDERVTDRGPYEGHPADNETGHATDCPRHQREILAYRTRFDLDQDWEFER